MVAIDLNGNSEVMGAGPPRSTPRHQATALGWSIDGLPDGHLLVTGKRASSVEPDGSMVRHTDLSGLADFCNEIVVDGRGNIYGNSIAFQFLADSNPTSGIIALVALDGTRPPGRRGAWHSPTAWPSRATTRR